jgi:hypothetical protein
MVTIRIKENSKQAKAFLEFIKNLPFVEFVDTELGKTTTAKKVYPVSKNIPNSETAKAINEAKSGKVYRSENINDLIKHLNS